MASINLEEKRLKQLKQQLFGKEQPVVSQLESRNLRTSKHSTLQTAVVDQTSLRTDLIRIVSFSLAALAIQFSLFFANRQGLINLFR